MAGGEKAKSSGEYGEKIVGNLLKIIGWDGLDDGVTVPCIHNEAHSKDGKNSEKHGIDYVYQYKSALRDSTRQDILISVKCRDGYPKKEKTIRDRFKEFYEELIFGAECYPSSDPYQRKVPNTKKRSHSGVIFWIDRNRDDGRQYESLVEHLVNVRLQDNNALESVALIDNNRAQFLFESITYVNNTYGEENVEFFYIDTGLNNMNLVKKYSGKSLPVEYINSDVIPLHIEYGNTKILFLIVRDLFDKDTLKRLIGLAQDITRTWSNEIIIAFPDYNEFEHKQFCNDAILEFDDKKFTKLISVTTYKPDFRDEV
ncbi:hypothetical protein [Psychrobacillus psychrodurans]|uniref:GAPS4 PD-(D/E)XK nuclease domain-containing protein n=1 Tax=Psychrobacillus psychrodurans TaxID=126157 RepID=A0A9X3R9U4_9BACI|nr:hypothetical protein [Psychrobacillus psychrodurans]MCZ8533371.1 hypothetical protein [Psychrobacillus psychrodurans]